MYRQCDSIINNISDRFYKYKRSILRRKINYSSSKRSRYILFCIEKQAESKVNNGK